MSKIIHSMIRVLNLDHSLKFYADCFGLQPAHRLDFPSFSLVYLRNAENDAEIELTWNKDRTEPYSHGDGYGQRYSGGRHGYGYDQGHGRYGHDRGYSRYGHGRYDPPSRPGYRDEWGYNDDRPPSARRWSDDRRSQRHDRDCGCGDVYLYDR